MICLKSKEEFKIFVSKYPSFASHVKEGKTSWQKLFELYNLYDEKSNIWDEYKKDIVRSAPATSLSLSSILNSLKGINLDSFQNNLTSIQKAVSLMEEFTRKEDKKDGQKSKPKDNENIDRFYSD